MSESGKKLTQRRLGILSIPVNFSLSNLITLMTFLLFLPVPLARRRALRCPAPRSPLASRSPRSLAARAAALARHRERRGRGAGLPRAQPAESGKEFLRERRGCTPDTAVAGRAGCAGERSAAKVRRPEPPGLPAGSPPRPAAPSREGGGTGEPSRAASLLFPPRGAGWPSRRPPLPGAPGRRRAGAPPPRPRPAPAPPPLRLGLGRGAAPGGEGAEPSRAAPAGIPSSPSPRVLPLAYYFLEDFQKKKKKWKWILIGKNLVSECLQAPRVRGASCQQTQARASPG